MNVFTLVIGPISKSSLMVGSALASRFTYGPRLLSWCRVTAVLRCWAGSLESFRGVSNSDWLFCECLKLPPALLKKVVSLYCERRDLMDFHGGRWWWSMRARAGKQAVMTPTSISTSLVKGTVISVGRWRGAKGKDLRHQFERKQRPAWILSAVVLVTIVGAHSWGYHGANVDISQIDGQIPPKESGKSTDIRPVPKMSISPILRLVCIWRLKTANDGRRRRKTSITRPMEDMGTASLRTR